MNNVQIEVIPIRKVFDDKHTYNNGFKIYSCLVPKEYITLVNHNNGYITIKGTFQELVEKERYSMDLTYEYNEKYQNSYNVNKIIIEDCLLEEDRNKAILTHLKYSESTIENLLIAYPNICDLLINGKRNEIDINKIKGFNDANLDNLQKKLTKEAKEIYILINFPEWEFTFAIAKSITKKFNNDIESFKLNLQKDPYKTLCDLDGMGFKKTDKLILQNRNELIDSEYRLYSAIEYILQQNEIQGNTYLEILLVHKQLKEIAPECIKHIEKVLKNDRFYIDNDKKSISRKAIYNTELSIAKKLLEGNKIKKEYSFDKEKYNKTIEGDDLTDKQMGILGFSEKYSVSVLCGYSGSGKQQPKSSLLLTQNGYVKMGDIKMGDKVFGEDGELHNVVGIFPQGVKDVYEIVFSDGTRSRCGKEHLWNVQTPNHRQHYKDKWLTLELQEIMERPLYKVGKDGYKKWEFYIPMIKPLNFKEQEILIEPYLLGCLLGDGYLGEDRMGIANVENDIISKLKLLLEKYDVVLKNFDNKKAYDYSIVPKIKWQKNMLREKLKQYNLLGKVANTKFVPKEYLYNTPEIRLKVLQGLIDTDGFVERSGYEFCTVSKQLCDDVQFLVQSFGGTATYMVKENPKYTYKGEKREGQVAHRLYIKAPKGILFHTSEKHSKKYKQGQTEARRTIREINYVGKEECQCIAVDNPTHLYLTNDCVVTHNTSSIKALTQMLSDNGKSFLLLAPTGKASKVLSNSTGYRASTIHRILAPMGKEDMINEDFVIIDEATMIDIFLMNNLLSRIDFKKTSIIFICDPAQLPSVGCGNILTNIIDSKMFPVIFLDKIFRYGEGGLSYVATEIRNGNSYFKDIDTSQEVIKFGKKSDYLFINKQDENIIDQLKTFYTNLIKNGKLNIDEITTLTSYKKGSLGSQTLNNIIQDLINPLTEENKTNFQRIENKVPIQFRIGDKVIQVKNNYKVPLNIPTKTENYDSNIEITYEQTVPVFNGEEGIILAEENNALIIKFDDRICRYAKDILNEILLGYSITIHKSQGSTYQNVIVVSPNAHNFFSSRNLLYVALTRARNRVFHIGNTNGVNKAIKKDSSEIRKTLLYDFLIDIDKYTNNKKGE